jgi:hypothetical protein
MDKLLIGISGKAGAGKDTFYQLLKCYLPYVENKKFADKLKQVCSIISGLDIQDMYTEHGKELYLEQYNMTVGQMQQQIGTEVFRAWDTNVWVKALLSEYLKYNKNVYWVITDVRFPNEAQAIRDAGGILIRINGQRTKTNRDPNHISETALDTWNDWDYVIDNSETDINDLAYKAYLVSEPIILEMFNDDTVQSLAQYLAAAQTNVHIEINKVKNANNKNT